MQKHSLVYNAGVVVENSKVVGLDPGFSATSLHLNANPGASNKRVSNRTRQTHLTTGMYVVFHFLTWVFCYTPRYENLYPGINFHIPRYEICTSYDEILYPGMKFVPMIEILYPGMKFEPMMKFCTQV
jgi:hypothetical protein